MWFEPKLLDYLIIRECGAYHFLQKHKKRLCRPWFSLTSFLLTLPSYFLATKGTPEHKILDSQKLRNGHVDLKPYFCRPRET